MLEPEWSLSAAAWNGAVYPFRHGVENTDRDDESGIIRDASRRFDCG